MGDIRGDCLGSPHDTTPAVVIVDEMKKIFQNSEHINEKGGGAYRGFSYQSLIKTWQHAAKINYYSYNLANFNRIVIIQMEPNIFRVV